MLINAEGCFTLCTICRCNNRGVDSLGALIVTGICSDLQKKKKRLH